MKNFKFSIYLMSACLSTLFFGCKSKKPDYTLHNPCEVIGNARISDSTAREEIRNNAIMLRNIVPNRDDRCNLAASWSVCKQELENFLGDLTNRPEIRIYLGRNNSTDTTAALIMVPVGADGIDDTTINPLNLIHPCPAMCNAANAGSPYQLEHCNNISPGNPCPDCPTSNGPN